MANISFFIPSTDIMSTRRMLTMNLEDTDHVRNYAKNLVRDIKSNNTLNLGGEVVPTDIILMSCMLDDGSEHCFTKHGGWVSGAKARLNSIHQLTSKNNSNTNRCHKCGGSGILHQFRHHQEGVCFRCGGSGVEPDSKFDEEDAAQAYSDHYHERG